MYWDEDNSVGNLATKTPESNNLALLSTQKPGYWILSQDENNLGKEWLICNLRVAHINLPEFHKDKVCFPKPFVSYQFQSWEWCERKREGIVKKMNRRYPMYLLAIYKSPP